MASARVALSRGFYGKLPARGDFVRSGLTAHFIAAWDDWAQAVLTGSRRIMGDAWMPAWLEAPVWRFALPEGLMGLETAVGLFMPSVDRVGRFFPLLFASLHSGAPARAAAIEAADWLTAAELGGRAALAEDLTPEDLAARISESPSPPESGDLLPPADAPDDWGLWWTAGSPRVPATTFALPTLPNTERFVTMLDGHFAPAESEGP